MDYLVALEAEDGTWYDEPEVVVGFAKARAVANAQQLPRGYDAVIYSIQFVETVKKYDPIASASSSDKASAVSEPVTIKDATSSTNGGE